jgi:hypothetical protein
MLPACWHAPSTPASGSPAGALTPHHMLHMPTDSPPPTHRYIYDSFVVRPGPRRCVGCYCTFTDATKTAIGARRFHRLTSNGVLNVMMINAAGGYRKVDDADHPLKEVRWAWGGVHWSAVNPASASTPAAPRTQYCCCCCCCCSLSCCAELHPSSLPCPVSSQ